MEENDRARSRRLTLERENFDDFLVALVAKLRSNVTADRILSGELRHPLIAFQQANAQHLAALNVNWIPEAALTADPITPYNNFIRQLTDALLRAPAPVPAINGMQQLQIDQLQFRQAETFIFTSIVETLRVGKTMHYARQCVFGAGQRLLTTIIDDNRRVTTRSLMAVFSTLISLTLRDQETFEQFELRIGLLIQRLRNWRPPIYLPEQLLLFCALRGLPAVPYGPVRHIILASPGITYYAGMAMLRDVANTGGELITTTLGSGTPNSKSAASI